MSCSDVSLDIRQNRKKVFRFVLTDAAGDRIDLAGLTLVFFARWASGSLTKQTGDDGFEIDGDEVGVATLTLSALETEGFPFVPIRFELYREIGGEPETLAEGTISVLESLNA